VTLAARAGFPAALAARWTEAPVQCRVQPADSLAETLVKQG
jgi:hypothetical protein